MASGESDFGKKRGFKGKVGRKKIWGAASVGARGARRKEEKAGWIKNKQTFQGHDSSLEKRRGG